MADEPLASFADLARRLAREAGAIALPRLGNASGRLKPDGTFVTDVDHEIEEHLVAAIRAEYPGHAIIGEETHAAAARAGGAGRIDPGLGDRADAAEGGRRPARYCWVIDPIDGTRNFVLGLPCFATSIAVLDRGQPVVGVVFEPNLGRLYCTTAGGGAWMERAGDPSRACEQAVPSNPGAGDGASTGAEGDAIRLRTAEPAAGTECLVGIASGKDPLSIRVIEAWAPTRGVILRNIGSTAMQLALVASGALHATFCVPCKIWDIAAGVLLVLEAGGIVTDPACRPIVPFDLSRPLASNLPLLAGAPGVHRSLVDSVREPG